MSSTATTLKCRTCFEAVADFYSLQEPYENCTLGFLLLKIAKIETNGKDLEQLPQYICGNCSGKLKNAYAFVQQAQRVNEKLLKTVRRSCGGNDASASASSTSTAAKKAAQLLELVDPLNEMNAQIKIEEDTCAVVGDECLYDVADVVMLAAGGEPAAKRCRKNAVANEKANEPNDGQDFSKDKDHSHLDPINIEETHWPPDEDNDDSYLMQQHDESDSQYSLELERPLTARNQKKHKLNISCRSDNTTPPDPAALFINADNLELLRAQQRCLPHKNNKTNVIDDIRKIKRDITEIKYKQDHFQEILTTKLDQILNHIGVKHMTTSDPNIEINYTRNVTFPIATINELSALNSALDVKDYRNEMIERLSVIGGKNKVADGCKVMFKIINCMFTPDLLIRFSWTGSSKSQEKKECFQKMQNVVELLHDVIFLADCRHTRERNDMFLRDKVLKHSLQRMQRQKRFVERNPTIICDSIEEGQQPTPNSNKLPNTFKRKRHALETQNLSLKKHLHRIESTLEQQNQTLAKHTLLLERIMEKAFPPDTNLNIFPLKSIEELEATDILISTLPEQDLFKYVKDVVGFTPISNMATRFFSEDFVLQVNWDGNHGRVALKSYKIFTWFIFGAAKKEDFGYPQFEEAMRKCLRIAKNRFYKKTHTLKHKNIA